MNTHGQPLRKATVLHTYELVNTCRTKYLQISDKMWCIDSISKPLLITSKTIQLAKTGNLVSGGLSFMTGGGGRCYLCPHLTAQKTDLSKITHWINTRKRTPIQLAQLRNLYSSCSTRLPPKNTIKAISDIKCFHMAH